MCLRWVMGTCETRLKMGAKIRGHSQVSHTPPSPPPTSTHIHSPIPPSRPHQPPPLLIESHHYHGSCEVKYETSFHLTTPSPPKSWHSHISHFQEWFSKYETSFHLMKQSPRKSLHSWAFFISRAILEMSDGWSFTKHHTIIIWKTEFSTN